VVEFIVLDSIPTNADFILLSNYITTKYGLWYG
jgi:ABC-type transport system involved in Fe-S cluster assembly fused permease/ATPase subunit